jgi:predicted amidohydrolase
MKVALIQSSIVWENPKLNRKYYEETIKGIVGSIDLIVLPEMFTTGFTMNPQLVSETMQGETVVWLQTLAKAKKSAITGSLIIEENGTFFNRLVFVFPSGEMQYYDKKHLFTLAGEDRIYGRGSKKNIIDYLGWKICPLVCYDLRFPVFSRNTEDYDLLLYVASWPKPRINAWDILIRARAVENMCYAIGVNRIGLDNNKFEYVGHSQAVDFLGNYVLEPQDTEGVFVVELSKEKMMETRNKLGFLSDRDSFELTDL